MASIEVCPSWTARSDSPRRQASPSGGLSGPFHVAAVVPKLDIVISFLTRAHAGVFGLTPALDAALFTRTNAINPGVIIPMHHFGWCIVLLKRYLGIFTVPWLGSLPLPLHREYHQEGGALFY